MFTNHIFDIHVKTRFAIFLTKNDWFVVKPNPTKPNDLC